MSATTRRPAPRLARAERIDEILDAARAVFCEKGYDAAVVAEIAARIGVVEGTIYKYFDSKRALLLAVLEHWYAQLFGDAARDLDRLESARECLRLLARRHLDAIVREPALCRLMFGEVRAQADYRGSPLHVLNRRYTQLLVETIERGVARGEFRGDVPPTLLRDLVYGGIEHHAWNTLSGRGSLDAEAVAGQLVGLLCEGLGASAAPARPSRSLSVARYSA